MKDDSGHMGDTPQSDLAARMGPPTKAESDAAQAAWRARRVAGGPVRSGGQPVWHTATFEGRPTAWQSIPKALRFAAWVMGIWIIIGFALFVGATALWLFGAGFALSQM